MKRGKWIVVSLALAGFFGATTVQAGQLIQDPSFELGPNNPYWSCSQSYLCKSFNGCGYWYWDALAIIPGNPPRTGVSSAQLVSEHDVTLPCKYLRSQVGQVFTIPSNVTSATLSFWVYRDGGGHHLWVELYNATSGVKYATLAVIDGVCPCWQYIQYTVSGLEQWKGVPLVLQFRTVPVANDDSSDFIVDDVTVNTTP